MKTTYQLTKYVPDTGLFCFEPKPWIDEIIDNGLTYIDVLEGKEALDKVSSNPVRRKWFQDRTFNIGDRIEFPNTIDSKCFKFFGRKWNDIPQLHIYCHYYKTRSTRCYPIKIGFGLMTASVKDRNTHELIHTTGQITQYVNSTMTEYEALSNLIGTTLIISNILEVPTIKRGFNGIPDRNITYNIYTIDVERTTNPTQGDINVKFHYSKEPCPIQEPKYKIIQLTENGITRDIYKAKQQNEILKSKSITAETNYVLYDSQVRIVLDDIEHLNEQLRMLQTMVTKGENYCKENSYIFQTLCESTSQLYNKFIMDLSKVSNDKIPQITVPWIDKTQCSVTFWNNAYYMFIKDLFDKL